MGLPHFNDSLTHGDLYIKFSVEMPKNLSNEVLSKLKKLLPKGILPVPK